jgi:formylglycine-generating enzyme required for sulfatase activity
VTFDQFAAFVAETGYDAGTECWTYEGGKAAQRQGRSWRNLSYAQTGSHPAGCLNWYDAKAYVDWLSKKTGKSYQLLTEAQWEYAVRAGTTTRYFFGDQEKDFCRYGNGADQTARSKIDGAQAWITVPSSDGHAYAAPVGSFAPNGFGLYDVHGNAWQWLEDCWHENYQAVPSDGSAWLSGNCDGRMTRGGSWGWGPRYLRAAGRSGDAPHKRWDAYGLRVARMLNR